MMRFNDINGVRSLSIWTIPLIQSFLTKNTVYFSEWDEMELDWYSLKILSHFFNRMGSGQNPISLFPGMVYSSSVQLSLY
jgi:hypothetical protein